MSAPFFDRLDRFVRWFFNSSPSAVIEPSPKPLKPLQRSQPPARADERKRPARAKPRVRSGTGATTRGSKAAYS